MVVYPVTRRNSTVSCDAFTAKNSTDKNHVLNLVQQKKWTKAMNTLRMNQRRLSKDCASKLLFLACEFNPPQRFIDTLIDIHPDIVFDVDSISKKTPLHVACEYGASPYVIELLVIKNKDSLIAKDFEGKLPLHRVCESYVMNYDEAEELSFDEDLNISLFETLEVLLESKPQSVFEEDDDGICPIEHAILSDSAYGIVQFLRKVSEKERRLMARSS